MTEQQKKEIEKIWGKEMQEASMSNDSLILNYFWFEVDEYDIEFHLTTKSVAFTTYTEKSFYFPMSMEINSKIQQTLKVLGWIE